MSKPTLKNILKFISTYTNIDESALTTTNKKADNHNISKVRWFLWLLAIEFLPNFSVRRILINYNVKAPASAVRYAKLNVLENPENLAEYNQLKIAFVQSIENSKG